MNWISSTRLRSMYLFVLICLWGATLQAAWLKQGVYEGNITCVHVTADDHIYIGTVGAGVYTSLDGVIWTEANAGIDDPYIVAITSDPAIPGKIYCASAGKVYSSFDHGLTWSGMESVPLYAPITSLTVAINCGVTLDTYLYVGTYGQGVWRWNSTTWEQSLNSQDYRVLSLTSYDNTTLAGIEYDANVSLGGLYACNDCGDAETWVLEMDTANFSFMSASSRVNPDTGNTAIRLAGSDGSGIFFSTGGTFAPYSDNTPYSERFQTVDFSAGMVGDFEGISGTEKGLWCLVTDPRISTTSGYSQIEDFSANISSVTVLGSTASLVGTMGKGMFLEDPGTATICDVPTNVSHGQIQHRQVNRIVISANYTFDNTMMLASRSEGIYKSKGEDENGQREFARFFCNPDGYGPVEILSLALVPDYNEYGVARTGSYTSDKVILAGSNGAGIFLTENGGASWVRMNNGDMPANAVIIDVAYVPDAPAVPTAFAAVKDRGLLISNDMGQNWTAIDPVLVGCPASVLCQINRIAVSPLYATDQTIWVATTSGLLRYYYNTGNLSWYCEAVNALVNANSVAAISDGLNVYVYFGTHGNGMYRGTFNGTWTEVPMADAQIDATATMIDLAVSPDWFTDIYGDYIYLYALKHDSTGDKIYYTADYPSQIPGSSIWTQQISPYQGVIQTIALPPGFDPTDASPDADLIFVGSSKLGLYYGIHGQIVSETDWEQASGYYAFPHEITVTVSDPTDPNIVFFGTRDMGMFVSYDGGQSACPWGRALDGTDSLSTTDITAMTITNDIVSRTVLIGTKNSGVYSTSYSSVENIPSAEWLWSTSTEDLDAIQSSWISELVFFSNSEALWASIADGIAPVYYYDPAKVKAGFALNWTPVTGGLPAETFFNAVTYGQPMKKECISENSEIADLLKQPRGIVQEMWCASGDGKNPYKSRISGKAEAGDSGAYRFDGDFWIIENGTYPYNLSGELYYDAIDINTNYDLFIGGWTDDPESQVFSGMWRSSDDATTWFPVNAGLTTLNMKTISSILETSDGKMLIGIKDNDDGGVFMSDNDGYAWARIDTFTVGERGVNDLYEDEDTPPNYWASMVNGGSQQETSLTYVDDPTPEFLVNNQDRTLTDSMYSTTDYYCWWAAAPLNSSVTFTSKSAGVTQSGLITNYEWDFDGDLSYDDSGSTLTETSYTYTTTGLKTVTMRLNSDPTLTRSHTIFIYDDSVSTPVIPDGDGFGNGVIVTKDSDDDDLVIVTWDYAEMQSNDCLPRSANILYGSLETLITNDYTLSGAQCSINGSYEWDISGTSDIWFVVVSDDEAGTESSWGTSVISGSSGPRNGTTASGRCGCTSRDNTGACSP
ncbi:hypothetical protein JXQ70_16225 [bacterium]|nr:hypothetical protein [bacterium]